MRSILKFSSILFFCLFSFKSALIADVGPYFEDTCTFEDQQVSEENCSICENDRSTENDECNEKFASDEYEVICSYSRGVSEKKIYCKKSSSDDSASENKDDGGCSLSPYENKRLILGSASILTGLFILLLQLRRNKKAEKF